MNLHDHLASLPEPERARLRGFLEGLQFAQRLCDNRAADCSRDPCTGPVSVRADEARICSAIIRLVQVNIGARRQALPVLTADEQDAIGRIA